MRSHPEPADTEQHNNMSQRSDEVNIIRRGSHSAGHLVNLNNIEAWVAKQRRLFRRPAGVMGKQDTWMDTTSLHHAWTTDENMG